MTENNIEKKDHIVFLLLMFFFGVFGIGNAYVGMKITAALKLILFITSMFVTSLYSSIAIIVLLLWNLIDIIFVKRDWEGGESKGFKWAFFVILLILSPSTYSNLTSSNLSSSASIGREGFELIKTGSYENNEVLAFKKWLIDGCMIKAPNEALKVHCECISNKTIVIMGKDKVSLIVKENKQEEEKDFIINSMLKAAKICKENNSNISEKNTNSGQKLNSSTLPIVDRKDAIKKTKSDGGNMTRNLQLSDEEILSKTIKNRISECIEQSDTPYEDSLSYCSCQYDLLLEKVSSHIIVKQYKRVPLNEEEAKEYVMGIGDATQECLRKYEEKKSFRNTKSFTSINNWAEITLDDIEFLIASGADINARTDRNTTPLMDASAQVMDPAIIEALIKNGANIEAKSRVDTPLLFSTLFKNTVATKVLLKHGANVNIKDDTGRTPLHNAIGSFGFHIDLIEMLIENGADINAKDNEGRTPLYFALTTEYFDTQILDVFIKANADLNIKYTEGNVTALMIASVTAKNPEVIDVLIKNGADINARNKKDLNSLMIASKATANPKMVESLINNGIDVNAKTKDGATALMLASAKNNNPEIIKTLIDKNAEINSRERNGLTPLMYACYFSENPEIIKVLIDNGAEVKATDNQGKTAFFYAGKNINLLNTKVYSTLEYLTKN